ncbi:hypothetical protein HG536_0B00670 [Torulaspora globosa]|uniref:SCP domain-containing protein n=1 Tax=Torulaspora globosa TaxID=48254 RepID=A0A7G3ZCH0_9SACH|nr:uncharacterized protein HG536_0B00670 [Torulaspora globosa]QLL31206.1 hypothetical protein HG536_0B00670 [Torulaspora globosa]
MPAMKSIAVSLSLLAAVSSAAAQTTVWEDFTATVTAQTFFKSGISTSAEISSTPISSPSLKSSSSPSSSGRPEITGPVVTSSVPGISSTSSGRSSIGSPTGSSSFRYSNSTSVDVRSPYSSSSYVEIVSTDSSQAASSSADSMSEASTSDSSATDQASSTGSLSSSSWDSSQQATPSSSWDSSQQATSSSQVTSAAAPSEISSETPSSSSSTAQPTTLDSATANLVLAEHNAKRALHINTPPLTWSDDLSAWAYNYANSLKGTNYDPCSGNLLHSSTRNNQGENIAFGTYSSATALVDFWYNEIRYYDFNNVTGIVHDGYDVGHFTQLVWASTTEVGCAAIECPANNGLYLLCEYTPAGNVYVGNSVDTFQLFRTNVLPLIPE